MIYELIISRWVQCSKFPLKKLNSMLKYISPYVLCEQVDVVFTRKQKATKISLTYTILNGSPRIGMLKQ